MEYYIIEPDGRVALWVDPVSFPLYKTFIYQGRTTRVRRFTYRTIWLEWADYVRPLVSDKLTGKD